jgi:hypothetical protein
MIRTLLRYICTVDNNSDFGEYIKQVEVLNVASRILIMFLPNCLVGFCPSLPISDREKLPYFHFVAS